MLRGSGLALLPLILLTTLVAAAPNDPGHDTLYLEEQGAQNLTGSLNISEWLRVAEMVYSDYIEVLGNGSDPSFSRASVYGKAGNTLHLDAPGNIYLQTGTGSGTMVYVGTTNVDLNVSRDLYVEDDLIIAGTERISDAGVGTFAASTTVGGSTVCTASNGLCDETGTSSGGGWTNTSTTTSTDLNVTMTQGLNVGSGASGASDGRIAVGKAFSNHGGYGNALDVQGGIALNRPNDASYTYLLSAFSSGGSILGAVYITPTAGNQFRFRQYTDGAPIIFDADNSSGDTNRLLYGNSEAVYLYSNHEELTFGVKDASVGIGTGTDDPAAQLEVRTDTSTEKGIIIQGAASQSANLQEWQDSGGSALAYVNGSGILFDASGQVCTASNGLCNQTDVSELTDSGNIYQDDISGSCTYGIASIDDDGSINCASQQGSGDGNITGSGTLDRLTYWTGSGSIGALGAGTSTQVLHGNAGGAPTWGAVDLANDVTGTLPAGSVGNGLTDTQVNNDLTVSGGTLGSNSISTGSTWTVNDDLTISTSDTPTVAIATTASSSQDAILQLRGARTTSSTSDIAQLEFYNDESGGAFQMAEISARNADGTSGTSNSDLLFYTNDGSSLEEAMRIDDSGYVGIGTSSPNQSLHVAGNIYATTGNDICIDGGVCLGTSGGNLSGSGSDDNLAKWSSGSLTDSIISDDGTTATVTGNLVVENGATTRIFMGGTSGDDFGIAYSSGNPDYGIFYKEGSPDIVALAPDGGGTSAPALKIDGNGDLTIEGELTASGTGVSSFSGNIDMNNDYIRDLGGLYKDDSTTNFFSQSCTYGIESIAADGTVSCAAQQGTGAGSMDSWTLQGDSGTPQTVSNDTTVDIAGGTAISTAVSDAGGVKTITITNTGDTDGSDDLTTSASGQTKSGTLTINSYAYVAAPSGLVAGNDAILRSDQGSYWTELRAQDASSTSDQGLRVRTSSNSGSDWTDILVATGSAFTYSGNTVWHAGNDGDTSGLDADTLDGEEGSYYLSASNINAGTLGTGYYSAYGDLTAENYLNNDDGGDLLTRDQADARYTGTSTDNWVNESGDTMTGTLTMSGAGIAMGGNRVEGLGDPNSGDDAMDRDYADGRYVTEDSADTMSGSLTLNDNDGSGTDVNLILGDTNEGGQIRIRNTDSYTISDATVGSGSSNLYIGDEIIATQTWASGQFGSGDGNITGAGTADTLAKFTAAGVIGDSILSESATTVTINSGDLVVEGGDINVGAGGILRETSGILELYSDNAGSGDYIELQSNSDTYGIIIREDASDGGSDWGNLEVNSGVLYLGFNNAGGGITLEDNDCLRVDSGGGTCSDAEGLTVDGATTLSSTLSVGGTLDMNSNQLNELSGLYSDGGSTNFFSQSCTYGIESIAADGTVSCASQQGSGDGTLTSITAGDGMDFTEITTTGNVTLGVPSTLTSSTTNAVTSTSHTHAITTYDLSGTANQVTVTGAAKILGAATTLSLPQNIHTAATPTFSDLTLSDDLFVNDFGRIDALRVGTTSTDPGDGRLYVEDYGVFIGGAHIGGTSDPGTDNLVVDGTSTLTGAVTASSTLSAGATNVTTINTGSGAMELGDAAIADGDTDSIPTNDQVYDFVTGQGYGSGDGSMNGFVLTADSGTDQDINNSDNLDIAGGTNGIDTVVGATDTITINLDWAEVASDAIAEAKIDFDTTCAAGSHLYVNGNNLACEADDDTTYSASGTLLDLTGTTFSVNEGTLTDGKICRYVSGTGIQCDTDDNNTQLSEPQVEAMIFDADAETVTGVWTYSAIPAFNGGTTGASAPFTVDSTYVVTNLNADLLDGESGAHYLDNTDEQTLGTSGNTITLTNGGSVTAPYATNAGAVEGTDLGTLTNTYLCTYDGAGTEIDCNTDPSGFGTGDMDSWTIGADSGSTTVSNGELVNITGSSTIDTSEAGRVVQISVQDDSIGDTQLAYDTGQALTTTSNVQHADLTLSDDLFVNDFGRIDALRVGTTSTDPGDGRIYVEDYGVFIGGAHIGGTSDPGTDNLVVDGTSTLTGAVTASSTLSAGATNVTTINTGSGAMELGDAAIADGDTDSIPTNDQVYDFVTGQGYGTGDGNITGSGTNNYVATWNNGELDNGMIFDNGLNVGIGDDNPDFSLEVVNGSTNGAFAISSAAGNDGDLFIIDQNGNVGIGEKTPSASLTIGPDNFNNYALGEYELYVRNDIESDGTIYMSGSAVLTSEDDPQVGTLTSGRACYTTGTDVRCDDTFYWNSGSNYLGIGANPSEALDIAGNIEFTDGADRTITVENAIGAGDNLALAAGGGGTNQDGGALVLLGGSGNGVGDDGDVILAHDGSNPRGYVGIRMADPSEALDIAGNIEFDSGSDRQIKVEGNAGDGDLLEISAGSSLGTGTGGDILLFGGAGSGAADGNVILTHTGSAKRGYVGIGTDNPLYDVDITDASADAELMLNGSGNNAYLYLGYESAESEEASIQFWPYKDGAVAWKVGTVAASGNLYVMDGSDNKFLTVDDAGTTGNVGVNTDSPNSELHVIGGLCVEGSDSNCDASDGSIRYSGNLTGFGADLAELIHGEGPLEPGDVVVISEKADETVTRSAKAYDTMVAGIVSEDPSHLMSADEGDTPLALAGRVPVKVTSENGPVKRGDLLTTSSTPGHAMRCADRWSCAGVTLGKALENLEGEQGLITALIMLG